MAPCSTFVARAPVCSRLSGFFSRSESGSFGGTKVVDEHLTWKKELRAQQNGESKN